ncbi:MAG: hypothetical protein A2X36_03880 [Elusimicrobia bacterium GWA2_69_24]|nr:MAG: hypothetical protein A2X36_03880 [Elusimicrobia bacterium GWA2_69_24]HBL18946.1 DNA-binding response regulator [Elusimicrobiota bacterium]
MTLRKRGQIRVFLVDDHPVVREGVRAYLSSQKNIVVVGDAANAADALRKAKELRPEVVVLDISLPSMDGGELARRLRKAVPDAKLLAFSIHSSEQYVVRMARCGAHGYVVKDEPTAHLVQAIQRLAQGGLSFPADMTDAILSPESKAAPRRVRPRSLTGREQEVLSLVAAGLANKQVAAKLGISVRTVEAHRDHLSRRLGIRTVAGLTKYAIQNGLTSLG